MRALPFGIPKLMVSTLASGQVRPFVGPRDILMFHSVTDISGINRISRTVLSNAAAAMAGMVTTPLPRSSADKPLLTATMFGVTTPCVEECRSLAEARGFETLVFHAVGTGGEAMETLIADGLIAGVLDVTTTELADELVGGVLSAGPTASPPPVTRRCRKSSPSGLWTWSTSVRDRRYRHASNTRTLYAHNENVTLMRTTPEECTQLGRRGRPAKRRRRKGPQP